jgi:DNA polymerase III delta subunit
LDYEQLVIAIVSGKVERVSQVIHIALEQKKGVNEIISTLQNAAEEYYQPRSYSKEEDMWGLLT